RVSREPPTMTCGHASAPTPGFPLPVLPPRAVGRGRGGVRVGDRVLCRAGQVAGGSVQGRAVDRAAGPGGPLPEELPVRGDGPVGAVLGRDRADGRRGDPRLRPAVSGVIARPWAGRAGRVASSGSGRSHGRGTP